MSVIEQSELEKLKELAVENFRTYLRIPSVQPDVDYSKYIFQIT